MKPTFEVQLKILKPVAEVFAAVVNPKDLAGYFVSASTGPLAEGTTVQWEFAECPGAFDVTVERLVPGERIEFVWPAEDGSYNSRVVMRFDALDAGATMVSIREQGWRETEAGVAASYSNAGGWMHMMCCLKGYLEYGINLRKGGAF